MSWIAGNDRLISQCLPANERHCPRHRVARRVSALAPPPCINRYGVPWVRRPAEAAIWPSGPATAFEPPLSIRMAMSHVVVSITRTVCHSSQTSAGRPPQTTTTAILHTATLQCLTPRCGSLRPHERGVRQRIQCNGVQPHFDDLNS